MTSEKPELDVQNENDADDSDDDLDADAANPFNAARRLHYLELTNLARYVESPDVVVNRFDTLEFPQDFENDELAGRCFVFDALFPPKSQDVETWRVLFDYFDGKEAPLGDPRVGGKRFGVLLALEIFRDEMNWARQNGTANLLEKLKAAGAYPFSDLDRDPVV